MDELIWTPIQWLYDALVGLWLKWLNWHYEAAESAWVWLKGILVKFVMEIWQGLLYLLPVEVIDIMLGVNWGVVNGYLSEVSWILPVGPALGMLSTTLGVCGLIRLGRGIKSCIPTISGA